MLSLDRATWLAIVAHTYNEAPLEMCGLLAAPPGEPHVARFYPCRNAAASARVYTVEPRDHLRADRDAQDNGWEIMGVVHSHTHSPAYPSPTDVASVADPAWHYAIVSLADGAPVLRSYLLADGNILEETAVVRKG